MCECLSIDSMFFYLFSIAIFSNFNLLSSLFCGTCGCVVAIIFFISCLCLALSFSICVYVWGVCIIHFRQLDPDFWNDFLITAFFYIDFLTLQMTIQIVISIYMIIIVICVWLDLFIYCCWLIVFTSSHSIFCVYI